MSIGIIGSKSNKEQAALHFLMYSLAGNRNFARKNYISQPLPPMLFWSPEAAPLLVSTKNCELDLWPGPTPEVRDSRTSHHSAHAQNKSDKSD